MAKYDPQAALALRLVSSRGRLVTFTRPGQATDPITQQPIGSDTTYDANMVGLALSAGKARYLFGEGADITKPRLSVTIALSGVGEEPRNGDRFSWNGKTYTLLSIEALDPAGEGPILATGYAEAA
ncbi:MAG: hypothetical protein KJZ75_11190 [Hyphomonadaceae bacterium]|nr:hypothetical protein [Hyphomonadaceae bacterium]